MNSKKIHKLKKQNESLKKKKAFQSLQIYEKQFIKFDIQSIIFLFYQTSKNQYIS